MMRKGGGIGMGRLRAASAALAAVVSVMLFMGAFPLGVSAAYDSFEATNEDELAKLIMADGSATVTLLEDIQLTSPLTIPSGAEITLTGAHRLIGAIGYSAVTVQGNARLILDGGITVTHVTHSAEGPAVGRGVTIDGNGMLTIVNAAITGNGTNDGNGGGVYAPSGSVGLSGGSVTNNHTSGSGGGISAGMFTISGGTVSGNTAGDSGGGVHVPGGFTMSGGAIDGNRALGGNGGGVYAPGGYYIYADSPYVTIAGGSISGNEAMNGSGGGLCSYVPTIVNDGMAISGNTAGDSGGGISISRDTLTISGGTISGNTATAGSGGGVAAVSGASAVAVSGGTISGNHASNGSGGGVSGFAPVTVSGGAVISGNNAGTGGGVGMSGASLSISGGKILENTASGSGGGGVYMSGSTFSMSGGEISRNTASGGKGGGVLTNNNATAGLTGGTISGNRATGTGGQGGGIYSPTRLTMSGGTVSGNAAGTGGGVASSDFTMSGGIISGNTAESGDGGGVYGTATLKGGEISGNNAPRGNGGGIYSGTYFAIAGTSAGSKFLVHGNSAVNGGGLYCEVGSRSGSLALFNCEIYGNTATDSGGGVYVRHAAGSVVTPSIKLSGAKLRNNTAGGSGGGIYLTGGVLDVPGGSAISQNKAGANGGGVCLGPLTSTSANISVSGELSGNSAAKSGGGVYADPANSGRGAIALSFAGAAVKDNLAQGGSGGAVCAEPAGGNLKITVSSATFSGNKAPGGSGGAIYVPRGALGGVTVRGSTFTGNGASGGSDKREAKDDATYRSTISGTAWSNNFKQAYNNYDIAYPVVYTVTFKDYDKRTISEQPVAGGGSAAEPEKPSRSGYVFDGWDTDKWKNVTGDLEVTATYAPVTYRVTFVDWDDTVLKTAQKVPYGEAAAAPEDPEREDFTFLGWDLPFDYVTADITVTAQYIDTPEAPEGSFTVFFVDHNATALKIETVPKGEDATAPEAPEREGYIFAGWDKAFTDIQENLVVTAQYTREKAAAAIGGEGQAPRGADAENMSAAANIPLGGGGWPAPPAWALINLLLAAAGLVLAAVTVARAITRKRRRDNGDTAYANAYTDRQERRCARIRAAGLFVTLLMALAGAAVFLLTESIAMPMVIMDRWTIAALFVLAAEVAGADAAQARPRGNDEEQAARA